MKCEWCQSNYPEGTLDFYKVQVFDKEHMICMDCYERLRLIRRIRSV